ncbi:tyrosinase family protein [Streptomyces rubradiris]|uniref:tyrosinase family protein n=1 Tax=Streptomyces rubradiris TaxID=285531 RepID=UPI001E615C04|nr:tyrosinase family protein [Streptomyces rubradiris]
MRKNHLALTKEEKRRFVQALLEVKRKGIYDELVQIHIAINGGDFLAKEGGARVAHISPGFLPWHRQYLLELENALREVDDSVALPYWDWTYDQSPDSPLWSPDFMGGNGRPGDRMVMDGPFAHANGWVIRTSALPVGQPALNGHYTVDDRPYLTRDIGAKTDRLPTAKELADTLALPVYDCPPYNHESGSEPPYRSFRNHLEGYTRFPWEPDTGKLHSRGHRWTGGHMGYIASPNDPVFFLHHCFVDKCWAMWQERHPDVPHYLPESETEEVGGLHTSLLPWHTMSAADLIDHTRYYTYE